MAQVTEEFVPLGEDLETKKNRAIKNILNVVDLAFDPEERASRKRDRVRKIVMDEVNAFYREAMMEINSGK